MKKKKRRSPKKKEMTAEQLVLLADKRGVYISSFKNEYPSIISEATSLERAMEGKLQERVWALGGTWNGYRQSISTPQQFARSKQKKEIYST